jgi:hypothetical protein
MTDGRQKHERDINFRPLPISDWAEEHRVASIDQLVNYVSDHAQEAIAWYLRMKNIKRHGARLVRWFVAIATGGAAIVPLIAQTYPGSIQPGWASISLAGAVAAIGLNRYLGFSNSWMRHLLTEMEIREKLHRFLFLIEAKRAELAGAGPSPEDTQHLLAICAEFLLSIDAIVRQETASWSVELRSVLSDLQPGVRGSGEDQHTGQAA